MSKRSRKEFYMKLIDKRVERALALNDVIEALERDRSPITKGSMGELYKRDHLWFVCHPTILPTVKGFQLVTTS